MKRQRGIALLGVLWAGVVLAFLAGAVTDISRGDFDLARNQLEGARAELAAEAAAEVAILGLLNGGEDAISEDGAVWAWTFDQAELRVQVTPETGRIDLNHADEGTLTRLFEAAGADNPRAVAQAVIDFRDPDNIPNDEGAEDDDYRAEGYLLGAKDAPFGSVRELAGVMGVSSEIYRRAVGGLTVHGGRRSGQTRPMPPIVAATLLEESFEPEPPTPPFSSDLAATPQRIVEPPAEAAARTGLAHVHAEAVTRSGVVFALDLVIQAGRRTGGAYRLLDRRRGEVELFAIGGERTQ